MGHSSALHPHSLSCCGASESCQTVDCSSLETTNKLRRPAQESAAPYHCHLLQGVCRLCNVALSLLHGGQPACEARPLNLDKDLQQQAAHKHTGSQQGLLGYLLYVLQ